MFLLWNKQEIRQKKTRVCINIHPPNLWQSQTGSPQEFFCIKRHPSLPQFSLVSQSLPMKNIPTAATTMLYTGWEVLGLHQMILDGQKVQFCSHLTRVPSSMCSGSLQYAYWWTPNMLPYFFLCAMAFFWPPFHKTQLCGASSLKWSYRRILQYLQ